MNEGLKSFLNAMYESIDSVGELIGHEELHKAAIMEMAQYLMYLSASDGEIRWSEAKVISDYFDLDLRPDTINNYIRENNIYSTEFENTVPVVFSLLVKADNEIYKRGTELETYASELMINAYKAIGMELLESDGDVDDNEQNDIQIYINMLEGYLNDNLLARSSGVKTNITKSSGSVSAPTKSGVSAPKKG